MKVVFTMGGITHYLSPLLERIVDKGVDIIMVIPEKKDVKTIGKGVKLIDLQAKYKVIYSQVKSMWYGKTALIDLKAVLEKEKPDILVLGWPYFLQYYFDSSLRRLLKKLDIRLMIREIPFQVPPYGCLSYYKKYPVYDENMQLLSRGISFYFRSWFLMQVRKFVYNRADATLNYATSAYDVLPSYGIKKESMFVTYNTCDTDTLLSRREQVISTPPLLDPTKKRILHIGRLVKWKRVDLLLEAFSMLAPEYVEAELVIVGDGPELESLKDQASKLGLMSKISFVGAIYDPLVLGKYMYESTVYVLAGMGGLSINEAMCYSLPIICSVCDGTEKDLVVDGENGFYFLDGDAHSLKEQIKKVLSNPQLAHELGNKSFEIIQSKINLETVSTRYVEAFKTVVD